MSGGAGWGWWEERVAEGRKSERVAADQLLARPISACAPTPEHPLNFNAPSACSFAFKPTLKVEPELEAALADLAPYLELAIEPVLTLAARARASGAFRPGLALSGEGTLTAPAVNLLGGAR